MASLVKRLSPILATLVLGTTLFGSVAYAAVPIGDAATPTVIPTDTARILGVDGARPERERGDHHRRFCARLNQVLSRLVENGVITRVQRLKIIEAFNCLPADPPSTDRPSTGRPTAIGRTAAR